MRIRQIRPEFFTDPVTAHFPAAVQMTYVGLWLIADDAGWLVWDVPQIGALLYPYKPSRSRERTIEQAGEALVSSGRLVRYPCRCAHIPHLTEHQRIGGNKSYTVRDKHRVHTSLDVYSRNVTLGNVTVGNVAGAREDGAATLRDKVAAVGFDPERLKP